MSKRATAYKTVLAAIMTFVLAFGQIPVAAFAAPEEGGAVSSAGQLVSTSELQDGGETESDEGEDAAQAEDVPGVETDSEAASSDPMMQDAVFGPQDGESIVEGEGAGSSDAVKNTSDVSEDVASEQDGLSFDASDQENQGAEEPASEQDGSGDVPIADGNEAAPAEDDGAASEDAVAEEAAADAGAEDGDERSMGAMADGETEDLTIVGVKAREITVGQVYEFLNDTIKYEGSTYSDCSYQVAVKKVKTPAGGSYTFREGDTGFTPKNADKNKSYQVTYGIKRTDANGITKWLDVERTTTWRVLGDATIKDSITAADEVVVTSVKIDTYDGAAKWDDVTYDPNTKANRGMDAGEENGIVRTFDTITYNVRFDTLGKDDEVTFREGRLYFEIDLPKWGTQEAEFDLRAMSYMDTTEGFEYELATRDDGGQTLKFYYYIVETEDQEGNVIEAFPSTGSIPVYVNVNRMSNEDVVQLEAKAAMVYGTGKDHNAFASGKAKDVMVTCAPSYNIQLEQSQNITVGKIGAYDFSEGNVQAVAGTNADPGVYGKNSGIVYGQLKEWGVTLQLYNPDVDKGLKGIEFPKGDISFTVNFSAKYRGASYASDGSQDKAVRAPILFDAGPNSSEGVHTATQINPETGLPFGSSGANMSSNGTGRNIYDPMDGWCYVPYYAPWGFPAGDNIGGSGTQTMDEYLEMFPNRTVSTNMGTSGGNTVWDSGDWIVEDLGNGNVRFTVKDYVINRYWFPTVNTAVDQNDPGAFGRYYNRTIGVTNTNLGCFAAGEIFMVIPHAAESKPQNENNTYLYDTTYNPKKSDGSWTDSSGQILVRAEVTDLSIPYGSAEHGDTGTWTLSKGGDEGTQNGSTRFGKVRDHNTQLTDNWAEQLYPMLMPGTWNNLIVFTHPNNFIGTGGDRSIRDPETDEVETIAGDDITLGDGTTLHRDYPSTNTYTWAVNGRASGYYSGSEETSVGSRVAIMWYGASNSKGTLSNSRVAENLMMKFDGAVLTPRTPATGEKNASNTFTTNTSDKFYYAPTAGLYNDERPKVAMAYGSGSTKLNFQSETFLYGYLPAGSAYAGIDGNWKDDASMRAATEADLQWYDSIQDDRTCVAMLGEIRGIEKVTGGQSFWCIAYFDVATDREGAFSKIDPTGKNNGYVSMTVGRNSAWREGSWASLTGGTAGGGYNGTYSRARSATWGKDWESYGTSAKPEVYNSGTGVWGDSRVYERSDWTSGNWQHVGNALYPYDGDSLRIVEYRTSLIKALDQKQYTEADASDPDADENGKKWVAKSNYNLADVNDRIADFVLTPDFVEKSGFSTGTVVTVEDTLPIGMTFREGSCTLTGKFGEVDFGGEYKLQEDGSASYVVGGQKVYPDGEGEPVPNVKMRVEAADGGRQKLVWEFTCEKIGQELPQIHYSTDLSIFAGAFGKSMVNVATIGTTEDTRQKIAANGNYATAAVNFAAPALVTVIKTPDKAYVNVGDPIGFTIQWANTSVSDWRPAVMMDTLPMMDDDYKILTENGIDKIRGNYSTFHGTPALVGDITITLPVTDARGNRVKIDDYSFYYTDDIKGHGASSADYSSDEVKAEIGANAGDTWTDANGIVWTKAAIETVDENTGSYKVSGLPAGTTAWFLYGNLRASSLIKAHTSIDTTDDAHYGDVYNNQASIEGQRNVATGRVVNRLLSGHVWIDANMNGAYETGEKLVPGVTATLQKLDTNTGEYVTYTEGTKRQVGDDGEYVKDEEENYLYEDCPDGFLLTDKDGFYEFAGLAPGYYRVVFTDGDTTLGIYRATIVGAEGAAEEVDSDAIPTYDGVLKSATIYGEDGKGAGGIFMPDVNDNDRWPYSVLHQDLGLYIPPKDYDSAEISYGDGVKRGDVIPYKIAWASDMYQTDEDGEPVKDDEGGFVPAASTITITDPIDIGLDVDEESISDNGIWDAEARTITWALGEKPYGESGEVSFKATVNDAVKEFRVENKARIEVGNSAIDTKKLENPEEDKSYTETTPAGANQSVVAVGDVIEYQVSWGYLVPEDEREGAKDADVAIVDELDAGLTVDEASISDGGSYDASSHAITWNFKAKPDTTGAVKFKAAVNEAALDPSKVENDANVKVGEHPAVDTRTLTNPLPGKKYADDTPAGKDGAAVVVGDTIKYEIVYSNFAVNAAGEKLDAWVTVRDVVDPGLTVNEKSLDKTATFTPDASGKTGGTIVWRIPDVAFGASGSVTFEGVVNENAKPARPSVYDNESIELRVQNQADVALGNEANPEAYSRYTPTNRLENPVPEKRYAADSPAGADGAKVKVGDVVAYEISWGNGAAHANTVTVVDKLDAGLTLVEGSISTGGAYDSATHTITWSIEAAAREYGIVGFQATVNDKAAGAKVENTAGVQVGDTPEATTELLTNPVDPVVTPPEKVPAPEKAPAPKKIKLPISGDTLAGLGFGIALLAFVAGAVMYGARRRQMAELPAGRHAGGTSRTRVRSAEGRHRR